MLDKFSYLRKNCTKTVSFMKEKFIIFLDWKNKNKKSFSGKKAESIRSFYFFEKNKCFSGKYRRINKIFHIKILFLRVFQ